METKHKFTPDSSLKLMDQVRQVLRYHHYAMTTERTYCEWILWFIRHFGVRRHPRDMGAAEVEAFLSHLVTSEKFSAATQRQALFREAPYKNTATPKAAMAANIEIRMNKTQGAIRPFWGFKNEKAWVQI